MGSLLTAINLPGIGDASPPDDDEAPDCRRCDGTGGVRCTCHRGTCHKCGDAGIVTCSKCNGTGREPAPDFEPDFDPEHDTPPYEGP